MLLITFFTKYRQHNLLRLKMTFYVKETVITLISKFGYVQENKHLGRSLISNKFANH